MISSLSRGRISAKCAEVSERTGVSVPRGRISAKCAEVSERPGVSVPRGRISAKCAVRPGSALLIVLGMLSFMVISGVAFSLYMRSSRLTSSFTRRASSTRQFAKAALAEAIDQIDRSIGNDPHPNFSKDSSEKYNHWIGRVLLTPYEYIDNNGDTETKWANDVKREIEEDVKNDASKFSPSTVPVLTAEALAYLPPTLVNEVRYFGRKTPTACWQTLDFDAGRYAYVAVDVSDYFDVNRVLANEARSSNPARRVNIAYLFEDGKEQHSGLQSTTVAAWETFMNTYTGRDPQDDGSINFSDATKVPFTSLADFNLTLGNLKPASFLNPFYEAFQVNKSGCIPFYGSGNTPGNGNWDYYTRQTFVTDSFAAQETQTGDKHFDLDDEDGQPFDEAYFDMDFKKRSFSYLADSQKANKPREELAKNRISLAGLIALADYLDYDDVPTSLAVPTTERVPMVCGVQPIVDGLKVVVSYELAGAPKQNTTAAQPYEEQTVTVRYKFDGPVNVDAWTALPFRDRVGYKKGSFKADCRVALFLSREEMGLRTAAPGSTDVLRAPKFSGAAKLDNGVVNMSVSGQTCADDEIEQPQNAVSAAIGFNLGEAADAFSGDNAGGYKILELTYQWPMVQNKDGEWVHQDPTPSICKVSSTAQSALTPILADGSLAAASTIAAGTALDQIDLKPFTVRFNLATWVTVRNGDGNVVDLAPACMADDRAVNSVNNDDEYNEFFQKVAGLKAPLLKFAEAAEGAEFAMLDVSKLCSGDSLERTVGLAHKNGIVVRDPRYNHAPENWFAAESKITPQYWYDNCGCTGDGRDGDIFMATSDQGYLQSVAELAFLPQFTDLNKVPTQQDYGDRITNPEAWSNSNKDYPAKGSEAQANMMWRTYNPFDRKNNADNADGFADLQEIFHHHGKGVRVNPYSDSTNIVLAALANTPISWRVASDNDDTSVNTVASDQTDAAQFNKKYAWNAYNSNNEISWEDLSGIAGRFMNEVREAVKDGDTWEMALQDIFCDDRATDSDVGGSGSLGNPEEHLCGIDLQKTGKFYSTDKKMLWGFWQNSFAANQQLFLVFFRAEPMMMGGGVAGATPPQLGARGVALVWRNPNNVKGNDGAKGYKGQDGDAFDRAQEADFPAASTYTPHQTRVLFYRQFE